MRLRVYMRDSVIVEPLPDKSDRSVPAVGQRSSSKPARRRVRRAELGLAVSREPSGPSSARRTRRLAGLLETARLGQHWRLIQAMIELSATLGAQDVTIAELCAGAGVSQQTFYEQFADKEDVLVRAYRASAEGIFGQERSAVAEGEAS